MVSPPLSFEDKESLGAKELILHTAGALAGGPGGALLGQTFLLPDPASARASLGTWGWGQQLSDAAPALGKSLGNPPFLAELSPRDRALDGHHALEARELAVGAWALSCEWWEP